MPHSPARRPAPLHRHTPHHRAPAPRPARRATPLAETLAIGLGATAGTGLRRRRDIPDWER